MNTSAKTRALYGPALTAADEVTNLLANPNFLYYAKLYLQKKITPRIEARRDRANQIKDYTTRVNAIARVLVEASESGDIKHSKFGGMMVEGWTFAKVKFGTLRLNEITGRVITSYIRERLQSVKPTTVQRELQFLAAVFNWIKDYDSNAWAKCGGKNPVTAADRNDLKIAMELKQAADSMLPDRRVTPQQRRALFDALNERENKELLLISALCHATGMRRSEAMLLRWQQLRPDYIQLGITKRGKPRKVPISRRFSMSSSQSLLWTMPETGSAFKIGFRAASPTASFMKLSMKSNHFGLEI